MKSRKTAITVTKMKFLFKFGKQFQPNQYAIHTLNLGFPPIEAATLAYVEIGLLLPRADCGRLAMVWELKIIEDIY